MEFNCVFFFKCDRSFFGILEFVYLEDRMMIMETSRGVVCNFYEIRVDLLNICMEV